MWTHTRGGRSERRRGRVLGFSAGCLAHTRAREKEEERVVHIEYSFELLPSPSLGVRINSCKLKIKGRARGDIEGWTWGLEKKEMLEDFTINWWLSLFPSYFSLFPLV